MDRAAVIVMALVALGALTVLASRRWARRLGFPVVLLALAGVVVTVLAAGSPAAESLSALAFVLILVFWLIDRGIPSNRPRPLWLMIGGVLMLVTSLLAVVASLQI